MTLIIFSISAMLCATLLGISIPLAANEVATYAGPSNGTNNVAVMSNKPNAFHNNGDNASLPSEKPLNSTDAAQVYNTDNITDESKNTNFNNAKVN